MNYLVSFSKARKKDVSTKFNLKKNQHSTGCGFGLVAWVFLIRLYFDQRKTVKKKDQPEPEKPSMKRKPEGEEEEEEEEEKVLTTDRQTQT